MAPTYSGTKAGLALFADALGIRLAKHGVGVSLVSPGFIDTPMSQGLKEPRPFLITAEAAAAAIAAAKDPYRDRRRRGLGRDQKGSRLLETLAHRGIDKAQGDTRLTPTPCFARRMPSASANSASPALVAGSRSGPSAGLGAGDGADRHDPPRACAPPSARQIRLAPMTGAVKRPPTMRSAAATSCTTWSARQAATETGIEDGEVGRRDANPQRRAPPRVLRNGSDRDGRCRPPRRARGTRRPSPRGVPHPAPSRMQRAALGRVVTGETLPRSRWKRLLSRSF